jgi:hypothetical protein
MASSANPDLWSDLSEIALSDNGGSEARAALLKVNAEMFVAAPARDRESIDTFETLMLGFLPRTDHDTLIELARILVPCDDTPASVLGYLTLYSPETRSIVASQGQRHPSGLDRQCLATPEARLHLASRHDLDPGTIERLLVLHEPSVEDRLAANPALRTGWPVFEILVRRAQARPALARILLTRADLTAAHEAALYLDADEERRRSIRRRMDDAVALQKACVSFKLTEHDVGEFFAASREGDVRRVEELLTCAFGFPASTDWRVLQIGRHGLLAIALKALGLSEKEATRIFLSLHPALSCPLSAVKALVREMRDVPSPVALALVEAILGVNALSERPRTI